MARLPKNRIPKARRMMAIAIRRWEAIRDERLDEDGGWQFEYTGPKELLSCPFCDDFNEWERTKRRAIGDTPCVEHCAVAIEADLDIENKGECIPEYQSSSKGERPERMLKRLREIDAIWAEAER